MEFSGYGTEPFDGAILTLSTGQWFTPGQPLAVQSTLVNGSIVPEASSVALCLVGVGWLAACRRRARTWRGSPVGLLAPGSDGRPQGRPAWDLRPIIVMAEC